MNWAIFSEDAQTRVWAPSTGFVSKNPKTDGHLHEAWASSQDSGLQRLSDGAFFCDTCWQRFVQKEGDTHTCKPPAYRQFDHATGKMVNPNGPVKPHTVATHQPTVLTPAVTAMAAVLRARAAEARACYRSHVGEPALKHRNQYHDLPKGYRFTKQARFQGRDIQ